MLFNFCQNTVTAIRQWLETMPLTVRPEPVRIRVEQSTQMQQMAARRQRRSAARYRR